MGSTKRHSWIVASAITLAAICGWWPPAVAQHVTIEPSSGRPELGLSLGMLLDGRRNLVAPVLTGRIDDLEPGLADLARLRAALDALRTDDWPAARRAIASAHDDGLIAYIDWLDYRRSATDASFEDIAHFIGRHSNWPHIHRLRRHAEATLGNSIARPADAELVALFDRFPPLSGTATLAYWQARDASPQQIDVAALRRAWVATDFATDQEDQFIADFGHLLTTADHTARLDRLAWEQQRGAAQRMFGHVDAGQIALTKARLGLVARAAGVNQLIENVPAALRLDPALSFERLRWRRRENLDDGALEILRGAPSELGRPDLWGRERNILARRALEDGEHNLAAEIAGSHDLTRGARFAELEFLAGWVSLTKIDQPDQALERFTSLYHRTSMPISRARGAYWAGRAAEAAGDSEQAQRWYEFSGRHPTVFYGQLALAELGRDLPPISSTRSPRTTDRSTVQNLELVRLADALLKLDEPTHVASLLLTAAKNTRSTQLQHLIAERAIVANLPHIAVAIAKFAVRQTGSILEIGYPIPPEMMATRDATQPEPALVLALIRQESTFRQDAISHAGARGLMQLMPATAAQIAREIGESYDRDRLISDPAFNMQLGSYFLAQLLQRYDGSYPLALAGYNAGPHRVDAWLQKNGDPRTTAPGLPQGASPANGPNTTVSIQPSETMIDWIESIPFAETRNYVQRVMEAVVVYRQLLATAETVQAADLAPVAQ